MKILGSVLFIAFFNSSGWAQTSEFEIQRENTRQILRTRSCGVCHIPPGNEKALKIFNLDNVNWYATLSDKQLNQFRWRILIKGDEIKEMHGNPKKHQFTESEIQAVTEYVDAEIKHRDPLKSILTR
jgi:mono/diheme cytochrome c family protein